MPQPTSGDPSAATPESQRITLPSPQPFPRLVTPRLSPGYYRIVAEEPAEESPTTRRSGRMLRGS